ncbi:MAG TPA: MBL fold metallo-hydrolase, partial [Verrucomicrobiales bacterium]|nr:MBL fold metallo-hydrolase [Verrucomicrobiales bacterium]
VQHASFVLRWRDLILYNDPVGGAAPYAGLPPAGLILVGHQHGDHFNTATLDAVRAADAALVVPPDVFDRLTAAQRETAIVLANGEETEILGLHIAAVPAYNDRHPQGRDNGYVLTIANRRIYISGDTGPTPEMLALQEIDLAFLCMNVPFTMTVDQAAEALLAFRPRLVYPYHYRNQDGGFANLGRLRSLLGEGSGVQVKEGDWY